jgi:hypothetical protein
MKTRSGEQLSKPHKNVTKQNSLQKHKYKHQRQHQHQHQHQQNNAKREQFKIRRATYILQRWWRSFKFINNTDFVTLDVFSGPTFHIKNEAGHIYRFDPINLANYFLNEGNFINPYNRQPISQQDLIKLDEHVRSIDPTFQSLVTLRQSIILTQQQRRQHEEMCQFLHEQCFGIIVQSLSTTRIHNDQALTIAIFFYEYTALPQYFDTFRQLFEYDNEFASESISSIIDELTALMPGANSMFSLLLLIFIRDKLKTFVAQLLPILPLIINARS